MTCMELCSDSGLFIVAMYSNPCRLSYSIPGRRKSPTRRIREGYHSDEYTDLCYVRTLCILFIAPLWCYSVLRWQYLRNWKLASCLLLCCVSCGKGSLPHPSLSTYSPGVWPVYCWLQKADLENLLSCFFSPLSSSNQVYFFFNILLWLYVISVWNWFLVYFTWLNKSQC